MVNLMRCRREGTKNLQFDIMNNSICKRNMQIIAVRACMCFYLFLYVLQQEGGGSQIVHWDVEEALNLFLMEVHGDQVGETFTTMCKMCATMDTNTHL